MTVRIVTDSTSDLPPDLARELDITVIPVYVSMRGRSYRDGVDISLDEIYRKMIEGGTPVTTSQPSPADFAEAYHRLLKEADNIISINLTSRLSGVYSSALQGRELAGGKGRIEVVDSASISMGMGLIAVAAARLAKAGASLPRVLEETKEAVSHVHIWAVLDSLKYVLRSGRLGRAKALIGGLLNVKPVITMKNGELYPSGIVRTRIKGIERLMDNFRSFINVEEVGIVQSTTPDEAQTLRSRLGQVLDSRRIHVSRLGPALGVHGGPGTLVLALRERPLSAPNSAAARGKKLINMPSFHAPRLNIVPSE
jgi:DegV family protein with EDD domain